jgi:hypothetical protein
MATSPSQRVYIKDRFAAVVRRIWRTIIIADDNATFWMPKGKTGRFDSL